MTPERKHELNKLMAEVVGKTVREDYVEVHGGPHGAEMVLAWVDENQFLWDPVDDANDSEVVEEAVVKNEMCIAEVWSVGTWAVNIYDAAKKESNLKYHEVKRVAFVLAVEQWWEAKKGQT